MVPSAAGARHTCGFGAHQELGMPEVVTAGGVGPQSSDDTQTLALGGLRCAKSADAPRDGVAVGKLAGWAAGIEVFKVHDVLYVPEFGFPVCDGFVPEEAI